MVLRSESPLEKEERGGWNSEKVEGSGGTSASLKLLSG